MSGRTCFLPVPDRKDGSWSYGVYVTASEVRDVLTSSHLHCGWEVTRQGELEPCGKAAVAVRYDENNGGLSEVCKAHAHRVLVPLSFIVSAMRPSEPESER